MVDLTPSVGVQVGEIQLEKSFDVVQWGIPDITKVLSYQR